jgi:phosphatidate cytidylyltransferase
MTKTRVIAALIMAPVAIAAILLLPTQWLAAAAAAVFLIGLWEWLKLADVDDTLARTVLLVLNLVLMVLIVWADAGTLVLYQIAALVGIGWWLLALLWLRFFTFGAEPGSPARALKLLAGTLAIVPAWASGAYFAGRTLGRTKLAPRISPNKTWEGLGGGMLAGLLVALVFGWVAGIHPDHVVGLIITSVVSVFASVLGDLYESLIKRHAGAKDSGHIIPGHGGVLDRIDGVLAALPVFALGKEIFGF